MISVIIPAHNEERVIGRNLRRMLAGFSPSDIEVIVVCNGCRDGTAQVARDVGSLVRVIETDVSSKAHAWNLGDREARSFPRFYVDADVSLSAEAIRQVAALLDAGDALAAAPRLEVNYSGASWPVRAFYRVWMQLPYFHSGMVGSGVFALSREGRTRFGAFPDLIADDDFVRLHFQPLERRTVESCSFVIFPPSQLSTLIGVKTRSRLGRMELALQFPDRARLDQKSYFPTVLRIARRPSLWLAVPIFLYVVAVTWFRARRRFRRRDFAHWDRDDSSRIRSPV
jgi:glycosyltransferase involved in cell wall biosynthesis